MTLTRMFQISAWACIVAIVLLSVVSPQLRPETSLPHNFEHAAIFVITGLVEVAQLYVPGRHARWIDFVVDAGAACAGVIISLLVAKLTTAKIVSRP
jgi:predicted membrane channel-forming protein YqfA (hemolysin III family)